MKLKNLARAGIALGILSLVGATVPLAMGQAADLAFPSGSAGNVYVVQGGDNTSYAAGTELQWNDSRGAYLSAVAVSSRPSDYEALRLPAVAGADQAVTFIASPGDEQDRTKWKAYSDLVNVDGKGILLPQVTPAYQGYGINGSVIKTTGGTYSLGVAYVKDGGQSVVKEYYTTIQVTGGTGAWKFATPGDTRTSSTTSLTATPASPKFGDEVTLTATVAPSAATGSVDFFEGTTKLGSGTLSSGTATFKTSSLAVGNHTLKAVYSGDSTYATSTSTNVTVAIAGQAFTNAPAPTISGTVKAGSTVKASVAAWTPAATTVTYQWLLSGKAISGATGQSLVVKAEWGGSALSVKVTGSKAGYLSQTKTSAAVTVPKSNFTKVGKPAIKGTAKVGKTLKASAGSWSPSASYKYQWMANGKVIKGATKSSFKLTKSQSGKKITVKVTATKSGYNTKSATSKATKKVSK